MFELKKSGDKFHFVLKAGNGQVILSSQMYASKSGAMNGIESVQKNCGNDDCWERKTAKNGKFHFSLPYISVLELVRFLACNRCIKRK